MKVKEAMTADPITIDPDAPVGTAVDVMRTKKVRHLPVVDDEGALVGVVTDRDLRHAALAPMLAEHLTLWAARKLQHVGEALETLRVRDVMTWVVATTHPEASLAHAAAVMREGRVGSLPVIKNGRLVGIITERDILAVVMRAQPGALSDPTGFLW